MYTLDMGRGEGGEGDMDYIVARRWLRCLACTIKPQQHMRRSSGYSARIYSEVEDRADGTVPRDSDHFEGSSTAIIRVDLAQH